MDEALVEPVEYLLAIAFLRHLIEEDRAKTCPETSYERLAAQWGVSKQTIMAIVKRKTIGIDLYHRFANVKFGGSVDGMVTSARTWWRRLDMAEQKEVARWVSEMHVNRVRSKRTAQSAEDRAEIERLKREMSSDARTRRSPSGKSRHRR